LLLLSVIQKDAYSQTRIYRQLLTDNSTGFDLSAKFNVDVRTCSETFKNVYTYGITPNDNQMTRKEHLAMFGYDLKTARPFSGLPCKTARN
jgi:hypothetical protein